MFLLIRKNRKNFCVERNVHGQIVPDVTFLEQRTQLIFLKVQKQI